RPAAVALARRAGSVAARCVDRTATTRSAAASPPRRRHHVEYALSAARVVATAQWPHRAPPRGPVDGDDRPFRRPPVPDDAEAPPRLADEPRAPPGVDGDGLLRPARGHHLPAHGPAPEHPSGELV